MSSTLQEELERSFGDGPEQPPVATHLAAGRRALRRRRTTAVALGAVLVLGGGYAAVAGSGDPERTSGDVVSDPTSSSTPSPTQEVGWDLGPVRYRDGVLDVHPDAVVHERIDNPFEYAPPRASVAFDLTFEGRRSWILAQANSFDDGSEELTESVPMAGLTFAQWVADEKMQAVGADGGWPDTLVLDDSGEVVAAPGSKVLQRTDDPRLGDDFAEPGVPTGAAVVLAADGQGYFVVWRVVDGQLDVTTVPPADVVGATFPELLSYARGKLARQEGLQ